MGQKVNPIGFRLGVNRDWRSRWYASPQELPEFLHNDLEIRAYVKKKLQFAAVSKIVIERAWITNTQIEAARVALTRNMKRKGKLWIRIFPDKSVTARPPETRMGKGKGQPEFWVATVRPGNILFELDGLTESLARESLRLAADKLPVRTKFISRHHVAAA